MRPLATAVIALLVTLVCAAPAAGHGFFVDDDAPPGGNCQSLETACQTLTDALDLPDPDPGDPDFIIVAPGTYTENAVLDNAAGRSLFASTGNPGAYVIEPDDPSQPTVEITGPSDIIGFTIGGQRPVEVKGPGRVLLNSFTGTDVPAGGAHVVLEPGAGAAAVEQNSFADDGVGTQTGVRVATGVTGSPLIFRNGFSGLWRGVEAFAGAPRIERNAISGPAPASSVGIALDGASGATISTNLIFGRHTGLSVANGAVTATNLTAVDNATTDIALLGNASLTLDSSIVDRAIALSGLANGCQISFSAGPAPPPGPSPCESFQVSSSSPGFADPASGDYRLTAASPLVDAGNPAAPPANATDLDGEPRAAAGTCGAPTVRDIGADELVLDCPGLPAGPGAPIPPAPPKLPQTRIDRVKVKNRGVLVRFSSDGPGHSFLCRLDGPWRACESPVRYRGLDPGRHVIRVKAVDKQKNEDPEPARRRFRIRR